MLSRYDKQRVVIDARLLQGGNDVTDRGVYELNFAKQLRSRQSGSVLISAVAETRLTNALSDVHRLKVHTKHSGYDRRRTGVCLTRDLVHQRVNLECVVTLNVIKAAVPRSRTVYRIEHLGAGNTLSRLDAR